ncbi:MAG: hypothetical protein JNK65_00030 [Deltaproteobacteria bacterium]|nr:hypothetical protein [Deltaproteobacteria bacterium]
MKAIALFLLLTFVSACGFQHPVQTALQSQKRSSTPSEYYSQARPASYDPAAGMRVQGQGSSESTFPETKGERSHLVWIGIVAGIVSVAGVVVPLVLLKN